MCHFTKFAIYDLNKQRTYTTPPSGSIDRIDIIPSIIDILRKGDLSEI
jgi:hypothetical protein